MSQSEDVLKKMEALLKKHQGGNLNSAALEEPADLSAHSPHISHDNPAIPTLTDVAVNAPPRLRARDAIPVVNNRMSQPSAADTALELDLDPYFIVPTGEDIAPEKVTLPSFDVESISAAPAPSEIEIDADTFIPSPAVPVEPPLPDLEHAPRIERHAAPPATPVADSVVEPPRYEAPPKPLANNYATFSSLAKESPEQITDSFTEQVLRHLDKHLKKALETSITPQLAKSLDKALSSMLDQFSLHIEHMVRETIARELNKQLESLRTNRAGNHSKQPDDPV